MSIPPYEPPKSTPSPGVGNTLLCPKCAGVMKTYERNGIHLEQCDTCRGIFLDFGELESLTQMENRFVQAAPPPRPRCSRATATTTARLGTPRQQALPQAGVRQAVLLQLAHPRAARRRAARRRDDGRRPGRRRPARTAPAPATGRRRQCGSVGVPVRLEEHRPVVVGDQAGRPEPRGSGQIPRRVADSEVVDVDQQPRRGRRYACRAGRDASRRAPASSADRASRPAIPRRATPRRRAARSGCARSDVDGTPQPLRPTVRWHARGHRLGVQPGQQPPRLGPWQRVGLWHNGFHPWPAGAPPGADRAAGRRRAAKAENPTPPRCGAGFSVRCGSVPGRCSLWTTSPSTTISAPDRVCTPRRISAAALRCGRHVDAVPRVDGRPPSRSPDRARGRRTPRRPAAYTSSGTWPSPSSVIASVSASAARSRSENRSPASSHAARTSSFCSLTPCLRASRVCMSRQKAQWLICDARILISSPSSGSTSLAAAVLSAIIASYSSGDVL